MCGIFGYSGNSPNLDKIKILGIYNESRGGDACGLFINNEILHGNGLTKTFPKLIEKSYIPKPKKNFSILGHTRKASVGGTDEKYTHPYAIPTKDNKATELVGVHNGTIYNWTALATKYDIPVTDLNDSKFLFTVLAQNKLDILSEYEGHAAFLACHPYDKNSILAFKGASKESYNYYNKLPKINSEEYKKLYGDDFYTEEIKDFSDYKEERPLFFYQESENSMYLSSIEEALYAIGGDESNVWPLPINKLYTIQNGQIVDTQVINRTKNYFASQYVHSASINKVPVRQHNYNHNRIGYNVQVALKISFGVGSFKEGDDFFKIKNHIYFVEGFYRLNQAPIPDGIYHVNILTGKVESDNQSEDCDSFAFVNGVPLVLVSDYSAALKHKHNLFELSKYALHPVPDRVQFANQMYFGGKQVFTLSFNPLFARQQTIKITGGKITDLSEVSCLISSKDVDNDNDNSNLVPCSSCNDNMQFCICDNYNEDDINTKIKDLVFGTNVNKSKKKISGSLYHINDLPTNLEVYNNLAQKEAENKWEDDEFIVFNQIINTIKQVIVN